MIWYPASAMLVTLISQVFIARKIAYLPHVFFVVIVLGTGIMMYVCLMGVGLRKYKWQSCNNINLYIRNILLRKIFAK